MPLDPAVAALAGTALGAGIGAYSTWMIERARWQRQETTRWNEVRRSRYAGLLVAMNERVLAFCADEEEGSDERTEQRDSQTSTAVRKLMGEIELIATPAVYKAAHDWFQGVGYFLTGKSYDWFDEMRKNYDGHERFVAEVRKELNLPLLREAASSRTPSSFGS